MMTWPVAVLMVGALGPGSVFVNAETSVDPVETVAARAFEDWQAALGVRQACSSGATIVFEALPSQRGEYRVQTQEVVIDPDGALEGMYEIVLHELSHHTFLQCGAFADNLLTAAFYRAQGLPATRDWFDYSSGWGQAPVEHFAETMATAIAGNAEGDIAITPEAVELLSNWLAGTAANPSEPVAHDPVPYSKAGDLAASVGVENGVDKPADNQSKLPTGESHTDPALDDPGPRNPLWLRPPHHTLTLRSNRLGVT